MKKTYQNPTTTIVKIKTVKMIATSNQQLQVGEEYSGGTILSREGDGFWEDDEE